MFIRIMLILMFLVSSVCAKEYICSWDYVDKEDISFRVYNSQEKGQYVFKSIDPENNDMVWQGVDESCTLDLDLVGMNYFVVTATDGINESDPSNEVSLGDVYITPPEALVICTSFPKINRENWSVVYVTSFEPDIGDPVRAFDGDGTTQWHTKWKGPSHPHEIQIDLGAEYEIVGFSYLSRPDKNSGGDENGMVKEYKFYTTLDLTVWSEPVVEGVFPLSRDEQIVKFPKTTARYIKLKSFSEQNNGPWTTVAEINVFGIKRD